jgi:hypothetical protein
MKKPHLLRAILAAFVFSAICNLGGSAHAQGGGANQGIIPPGSKTTTVPTGTVAATGMFPSAVRLILPGFACSGTLIHERVVITARHCVVTDPTTLALRSSLAVKLREVGGCRAYTSKTFSLNGSNVFMPARAQGPVNSQDKYEVHKGRDVALVLLPESVPCADQRVVGIYQAGKPMDDGYVAGYGLTLNLYVKPDGSLGWSPGRSNDLMFLGPGELDPASTLRSKVFEVRANRTIEHPETKQKLKITCPVCQGDSGGSYFVIVNGTVLLAGVLVAHDKTGRENSPFDASVNAENCMYATVGYITGTAAMQSWIKTGLESFGV